MSRKRSLILVVAGALAGAIVTALLFSLCNRPPEDTQSDDDTDDAGEDLDREPEASTAPRAQAPDLEGDCLLSGSVIGASGEPAEGAVVRVRVLDVPWSVSDTPFEFTTGKDGAFSFEGLNSELRYQLWAWEDGSAVTAYEDALCGSKTHLILEDGGAISFYVEGPDGKPASDAKIVLSGSSLWPSRTARASKDGKVTITGLAEGFFVYMAQKGDLVSVSDEPMEVLSGKTLEKTVELEEAHPGRLQVLDAESSSPIPGAKILVGPASASMLRQVYVTGDSGTAAIRGLAEGENAITVTAEGYVSSDPRTMSPGDDVTIRLSRGASISGKVLMEDGTPVMDATVTIEQELGESEAMLNDGPERTFSGRLVSAALSGWPGVFQEEDDVAVAGPPNIPLPSAIDTGSSGRSSGWGRTDSEGRFTTDGLTAGTVRVGARHDNLVLAQEALVTLEPGKTLEGVMVTMRQGARLAVRVLDETDYPIEGAEVSVYDHLGEQVATAESERDGFARIAGLPGRFRVEASAEGKVPAAARIHARSGEETDVEIRLPDAGEVLRGRVVDKRGYGVADVGITARSITRGLAQVIIGNTESDGTFVLEGVGNGSYHVTAEQNGKILAQVGNASHANEIKMVLGGEASGPVPILEPSWAGPSDLPPALTLVDVDEGAGEDDEEGGGFIAISHGEASSDNVQTEYGQADRLVVTGPPSGKGGLPVQLGGGPGNVIVKSVSPGSLVAGAGLSRGDRLLTVDGSKVKNPTHARSAIAGRIGSVVVLEVDKGGEVVNIVVQRVRVR